MIEIVSIKEHKRVKAKLMKQIAAMPEEKLSTVSKTDWHLPSTTKRTYQNTFLKLILPYMDNFAKKYHCKEWEMHNFWFHQYDKYSGFDWHVHGGCNFSNVYFLNLPNKKTHTEILDINSKLIKLEINEGDLLTFPGYLRHRSPAIKKLSKTIIAFNTSINNVNKI